MKKTLTGPGGIRLELDSREIFPDDPGNGTPAMVYLGDHSATFWWATGEGSLYSNRSEEDRALTAAQSEWLEEQGDAVADFIEENAPAA